MDSEYQQLQRELIEIKGGISMFTNMCDIHYDLNHASTRILKNSKGHVYSWTFIQNNCNDSQASKKLLMWETYLLRTRVLDNVIKRSCLIETNNTIDEIILN
jgi:hypothetical protein